MEAVLAREYLDMGPGIEFFEANHARVVDGNSPLSLARLFLLIVVVSLLNKRVRNVWHLSHLLPSDLPAGESRANFEDERYGHHYAPRDWDDKKHH
eukprot:CAMPEP_0185256494 /NCGR_PEP_ID=MMETSP1359-20130426/5600_1 /TAXON_ID=552665 /ORGANISM="Bigelowiella longifila, Strain CCMP242" /LENGTH=95 /DNA_ID=CAMNT_0027841105 /DNA_START=452 /DNA_END=739 /DNA_ORIENTATION=-